MQKRLLGTFARSLENLLKQDSRYQQKLLPIENRRIALHFKDINQTYQFIWTGENLIVEQTDLKPALTIHTTLLKAPFLLPRRNAPHYGSGKQPYELEGDLTLGIELQNALHTLSIDWENWLAEWLGDSPAYYVTRTLERLKNWASERHQRFIQNSLQFLQHEQRLCASPAEMKQVGRKIYELSLAVERLNARILHLEKPQISKGDST